MLDRSLDALGMAGIPALEPLLYPGVIPTESVLLRRRHLFRLAPAPARLGSWQVRELDVELDAALREAGEEPTGRRFPVLAVGSNGSPGQMAHKLASLHLSTMVPMAPVEVTGIGIGLSGHVSPAGYVSASPYFAPHRVTTLMATWLDGDQMAAVDATESPYHRILLPGSDFRMLLVSGEVLDGCYLYVHRQGVLAEVDGMPMQAADQSTVLTKLLGRSARLRVLFGDDPETFLARSSANEDLREAGTRLFDKEGWVLPQPAFDRYVTEESPGYLHAELSPLERAFADQSPVR